jgi:uncharacterized membrane protein HdeD (DUF308 family)
MNQLTYNWWTVALRGVLAIVVGLIAFFFPGVTLAFVIALFGAFALFEGVFLILSGIRNRRENARWWMLLIQGVISIGAGIFAFAAPLATAVALLYLMAAWAIASGLVEIIVAIRLRKEIEGEWMLVLDGLLTIGFGVALMAVPAAGLLVWMWMIGGFKLASGLLLLLLAFRLRGEERGISGAAGSGLTNLSGAGH